MLDPTMLLLLGSFWSSVVGNVYLRTPIVLMKTQQTYKALNYWSGLWEEDDTATIKDCLLRLMNLSMPSMEVKILLLWCDWRSNGKKSFTRREIMLIRYGSIISIPSMFSFILRIKLSFFSLSNVSTFVSSVSLILFEILCFLNLLLSLKLALFP